MSMQSIFISYRREDASYAADLIFNHLSARYKDSVFRDIDSIKPGEPFRIAIGTALRHCEVVVAVVGPNWLGANADGSMRINAPQDWVKAEIEMAPSARHSRHPSDGRCRQRSEGQNARSGAGAGDLARIHRHKRREGGIGLGF
jgi:hypothetical protein